jgi:hypothetical protein
VGDLTIYATTADLTTSDPQWVATLPDNADTLLRSASLLVSRACVRNPYGDDPTGGTADALRDATCAQVATWVALGINPAALGTDTAPVKTAQLGTALITRDTSAETATVQAAIDDLAPEPRAILTAAGLLWAPVPVGPSDDYLPSWGLETLREPVRWPFV